MYVYTKRNGVLFRYVLHDDGYILEQKRNKHYVYVASCNDIKLIEKVMSVVSKTRCNRPT